MAEQYLTHADYQTMGGKLDAVSFTRKEFAARAAIDKVTNGRIQNGVSADVIEKLKFLVLELIEQNMVGTMKGRKRSSESNNGLSVSYADDKGEAENLIRTYLANEQTTDGVLLINPSIMTARVLRT